MGITKVVYSKCLGKHYVSDYFCCKYCRKEFYNNMFWNIGFSDALDLYKKNKKRFLKIING